MGVGAYSEVGAACCKGSGHAVCSADTRQTVLQSILASSYHMVLIQPEMI